MQAPRHGRILAVCFEPTPPQSWTSEIQSLHISTSMFWCLSCMLFWDVWCLSCFVFGVDMGPNDFVLTCGPCVCYYSPFLWTFAGNPVRIQLTCSWYHSFLNTCSAPKWLLHMYAQVCLKTRTTHQSSEHLQVKLALSHQPKLKLPFALVFSCFPFLFPIFSYQFWRREDWHMSCLSTVSASVQPSFCNCLEVELMYIWI